jgi:hypothetical protein
MIQIDTIHLGPILEQQKNKIKTQESHIKGVILVNPHYHDDQ